MSEIVLQAVVDKLEAIEIALQKQQNVSISAEAHQTILNEVISVGNELKNISAGVKISNEKANKILSHLNTSREPVKDKVIYHHYLHKGLIVSIALFIVSMLLLLGWVNSYNGKKQYEANAIKYRALKIMASSNLLRTFHNIDSLYDDDPDAMRKKTIQEEERNAERSKLLRLAGEKEKEAQELKAKAKESR